MIEFLKNINIDFMGKRKYAYIISGILMVLGIVAVIQIAIGRANMGVDFAGGTSVQVQFAEMVTIHEIRSALDAGGLKDFDLLELPAENKVLIRVKKQEDLLGGFSEKIEKILSQNFADKKPVIDSITEIGPRISAKLRNDALLATIMAIAGLLIYIAWRFQFKFGIGATIATMHDVLAVLGIFYIMNKEINIILLSALLTIAGYSLSDTVVIFDRVRENIKQMLKEPIGVVINKSINEVLPRTLVTSLTTFFAAFALFFFGGEVLHDFALAIMLGIIIGTLSSIFIASPVVMLLWKKRIER
jgi:preprotein translocase subunit SecF